MRVKMPYISWSKNAQRYNQNLHGVEEWDQAVVIQARNIRIFDLLEAFHESDCVDGRDRIYAFSSIATNIKFSQPRADSRRSTNEANAFDVNYKKTVEQVYSSFARYLVEQRTISFWDLLQITDTQLAADDHRNGLPS